MISARCTWNREPSGRCREGRSPKEATPLAGEVCETCGLPKEVCVCQDLQTEQTVLRISIDTRRYGKAVTRIEGFEEAGALREMASELKRAMATGGTAKKGWIELQGDHRDAVKDWLSRRGYRVEG